MNHDSTICISGLGYVGLPTAALLARSGFNVLGVDINEQVIAELNEGRTIYKEQCLNDLVTVAVDSGRLHASHTPAAADIFIVCVPTPVTDGGRADLSAVRAATETIAPYVQHGNLVILESTSPTGTTRHVIGEILARHGLQPGVNVDLCYCPERVLPGDTVGELERNSRVIGGFTPEAADRAARMYATFCTGELRTTTDLVAELCKLMENSFRDVNIAIANSFAQIGEELGVDAWEAIRMANLHPRVDILQPGPGVGGHCIPVDPWFLIESFPHKTQLLVDARRINDHQGRRLLDRLQSAADLKTGDSITLLGVAYKADIDDPRDSPTLLVAEECRNRGINVRLHDPLVAEGEYHGFMIENDLDATLEGADAVMLLTDHTAYHGLDPEQLLRQMQGQWIADGRHVLDRDRYLEAGFRVLTLGIGQAEKWTEPKVVVNGRVGTNRVEALAGNL